MTDIEKQDIVKSYTQILDKYSEFIKTNKDKLNNISIQESIQLIELREKLLEFYNKFSDLEIETSKCRYLNNNKIKIKIEDTPMMLSDLNEVIQILLNRISIKYIYPITLQLNGLDNKKAKMRDFLLFASSIFISSIISLFTTWYFDQENDKDLENSTKTIINHQKNDSIMIKQNIYILRANCPILDSLKLMKK